MSYKDDMNYKNDMTIADYFVLQKEAEDLCRKNIKNFRKQIYGFSVATLVFFLIANLFVAWIQDYVFYVAFIYLSIICLVFVISRILLIRKQIQRYKSRLERIEGLLTNANIFIKAPEEDVKKFDRKKKEKAFKPKSIQKMKKENEKGSSK